VLVSYASCRKICDAIKDAPKNCRQLQAECGFEKRVVTDTLHVLRTNGLVKRTGFTAGMVYTLTGGMITKATLLEKSLVRIAVEYEAAQAPSEAGHELIKALDLWGKYVSPTPTSTLGLLQVKVRRQDKWLRLVRTNLRAAEELLHYDTTLGKYERVAVQRLLYAARDIAGGLEYPRLYNYPGPKPNRHQLTLEDACRGSSQTSSS